jgi:hypothetical protein
MHSIAFEEVKPVTIVRKNLPPQLHRIVSRCLRKRVEDRYPDAQALAADLKHLKQDIESGVRSSISPGQRIQVWIEWLKSSVPQGSKGIVAMVLALTLLGFLAFTNIRSGTVVTLALIGLLIYRYVRNRKSRMLNRFVAKISKFPPVKAIVIRENLATVVVDKAQAKIYLRISSLLDEVNRKLYFGKTILSVIKDDLAEEEFQRLLREPGVVYVRDDVVLRATGKNA